MVGEIVLRPMDPTHSPPSPPVRPTHLGIFPVCGTTALGRIFHRKRNKQAHQQKCPFENEFTLMPLAQKFTDFVVVSAQVPEPKESVASVFVRWLFYQICYDQPQCGTELLIPNICGSDKG